jgi:hypothetical protein
VELPLRQFTDKLTVTAVHPDAADAIALAEQPDELQPIAIAFSSLHGRLVVS